MILYKIANIFKKKPKGCIKLNHEYSLVKIESNYAIKRMSRGDFLDIQCSYMDHYRFEKVQNKCVTNDIDIALDRAVLFNIITKDKKTEILNNIPKPFKLIEKTNISTEETNIFKLTDEEKNEFTEKLYMKLNKGVSIVEFKCGYAVKLNNTEYLDLQNSIYKWSINGSDFKKWCTSKDLQEIRNHIKKYDKEILL